MMTGRHNLGAAIYTVLLGLLFLGALLLYGFSHEAITVLLVVLNLWLLSYFVVRKIDFFELVVLFALANLRFFSRPLYWVFTGEYEVLGHLLSYEESVRYANQLLALNLLGVICYLIGYHSRWARLVPDRLPSFSAHWSQRKLVWTALLYAFIGVSCFIIAFSEAGGITYVLTHLYQRRTLFEGKFYFLWGSLFIAIGFLLYASYSMVKRQRAIFFVPAAIAISLMYYAYGARGTVISVLAIFVIIYYYLARRLRFSALLGIAVALLLLAVALGEFRVRTAGYSLFRQGEQIAPLGTLEVYARNAVYFDSVMLTMNGVDQGLIPLQYGKTYLGVLTLPIPRNLWEDKPSMSEDKIVRDAYFGPGGMSYGIPIGFIGAMYINFHVPGIVIGFWLLGVVHKGLYEYLLRDITNPSTVVIYAVSAWWLHVGFSNGAIVHWLLYFLPAVAALRFVSARKEPVMTPASPSPVLSRA